jgi:8-oxo-dGTP diphosphatase
MAQARQPHCYPYPRPAVTVDIVIFTVAGDDLKVLLIQRKHEPFAGRWAIPGGFVDEDEPLEAAALRELEEETGVRGVTLRQLHAFGDPGRDPRGHTISIAYYVLLNAQGLDVRAADDAAGAGWFSLFHLPELAFDHAKILAHALARLRCDLTQIPVGRDLLPRHFTLAELKRLHEVILQRQLDSRAFRRTMLARGIIEPVKPARRTKAHRPRLYRFTRRKPIGA